MQLIDPLTTDDFENALTTVIRKIEIDIDGEGEFRELPDLKDFTIDTNIEDVVSRFCAYSFNITCLNTNLRYFSWNTASPYYGWLKQGRRIKIWAGIKVNSTDYYYQWLIGRVDNYSLATVAGEEICTITGRDFMRTVLDYKLYFPNTYWGTSQTFNTVASQADYSMIANLTERQPVGDVDKNWYCCSVSGAYMIAGVDGGRLYTSSDYGANWTERQPAGDFDKDWDSCSVDGAYMIAGVYGGRLYTSSDYGVSWTERQPAGDVDKDWWSCSVSGAYMIVANDERLYTSADYGVNWTERQPAGDFDLYWESCSVDGAYMIAGIWDGRLYTSADYGVNWTERQPAGDVDKDWWSCSVSGAYMIVANDERLYTSADYGVNWTERQPAGDFDLWWESCSVDGAYMIAGVYGGRLYTSSDYGVSWTERQPAGDVDKDWYSCSVSGAYMIAGIYGGRLYTSARYCKGIYIAYLDSISPYDGSHLAPIYVGSDFGYVETGNLFSFFADKIPDYSGTNNLVVYYFQAQSIENVVGDILLAAGVFADETAKDDWLANTDYITPTGIEIDRVSFNTGTSAFEAIRLLAEVAQYRFYFDYAGNPIFKAKPSIGESVDTLSDDCIENQEAGEDIDEVYNHIIVIGEKRETLG